LNSTNHINFVPIVDPPLHLAKQEHHVYAPTTRLMEDRAARPPSILALTLHQLCSSHLLVGIMRYWGEKVCGPRVDIQL